jgi:hypothetical protein
MIIPGFVVSILTFPGVVVHEAAHLLFCRLRGVAVLKVCFFRLGNPAGYVIHEAPRDFTTAFLICTGPLIVNSLLCMLLCFPVVLPHHIFGVSDGLSYVLAYLGLSIGMHAFPSTQDASVLWQHARRSVWTLHPLAILSLPLVVLIYVANILSVVWFNYIYGIAIGLVLPAMILNRLT